MKKKQFEVETVFIQKIEAETKKHGTPALVPRPPIYPKKNSSRENTSSEKNLGIFLLSFLGRVPAIFHWIHAGLCKCSFIAEIFNIKN